MPSYSFVGDEPMSTLCATESKSPKAPSLAQGNPPSFQHPCQLPGLPNLPPFDPVAVAAARKAAGYVHPSNQQENYSDKFRISHSQAGKLGVAINNGKQCIVVAKLNQNSQLNVNDIIVSLNGHKYEDLIKSEWLKLFQGPGVREFIVLRPRENNVLDVTEDTIKEDLKLVKETASVVHGVTTKQKENVKQELHGLKDTSNTTPVKDNVKPTEIIKSSSALACGTSGKVQVAPLKDIGNTNTKVPVEVVKIPAAASSSHDMTNEHLLQLVSSQWTTGKARRQTPRCIAAIRNCLLAGMPPFIVAKHVEKQVNPEDQVTECARAKTCAQRIQQSMNKNSVLQTNTKPLVAHDSNSEDESDDYVPWSGAASIVDSSDGEYNDDDDDDDAYESSDEELETAILDLHDIMKVGMPFQRKGIIFKRGDQPPKRKASVLEQGLLGNHHEDNALKQSRLCSQNEGLIGQQATLPSLFPAADKQCISTPVGKLITPSNSMEEPMSPLRVDLYVRI